ncbi:HpcH/HpaI aldolase/citrate lyase family protein [Roseibium salinum]|uniref:HpcH/HpaI aldolase/citrate lyase family protein n=1 Tax=Roseibium salinum TaxID=1604349 RepID=A0ABT3QW76_9HYPH|nr:HpcH/HpaI aldolase/citrate lyase family protein [Roseibium sp. DSM 29163]MCX2721103.1 HpcH/HpaI aldolase/citrate lyase family protein [Roseibium sp. DSM 29163]MDN3722564.1 HpcH/HpaI aldolase/citrate lyase family protein [Roseibium salinum]
MPAPENTLKKRLQSGETCIGCWIGLADPYLAEISATAEFDWLLIDGEHAPNDLRSLSAQLAAIEGKGPSPVVRLPDDDPVKIKQVLDIGAQTLLVPMVETAAQADRTFRAMQYPPIGFRGVGAALARASRFAAIPDYLTSAGGELCLLVQVENRAGLHALDDILAVDGVDGVFIGPSDLAADMGHIGKPNEAEVKEAVVGALQRIRAAGKIAGVLSTDPDYIDDCRKAGANFLGVGIDVTTFAGAMRALARKYR